MVSRIQPHEPRKLPPVFRHKPDCPAYQGGKEKRAS